jgi:hypothetical protein
MKCAIPFVLTLFLSIGYALHSQDLQVAPTVPTLQNGTPVRLRLCETVSSDSATVGQTVRFEVADEVRVGEVTVIAKRAPALATVTEARSSRSMGRGGKLGINIDSVSLVDGETVALRAVRNTKAAGTTTETIGAVAFSSILVGPAAALLLFMPGEDIEITEGKEITAYINGDVPLDIPKFAMCPVENMATSRGLPIRRTVPCDTLSRRVAEEDPPVVIQFTSVPTGADITIDGNFVGSTPSSITIATGEHVISIAQRGYRPYERTVTVAPGHPRVAAYLEIQKTTVSFSHHQ